MGRRVAAGRSGLALAFVRGMGAGALLVMVAVHLV